jgi:hypothetical protein
MFDVQNLHSLLLNSTYLSLLLDVIITYIEELVTGHRFLHALFIEVTHFISQRSSPAHIVAVKLFTGKKSLQLQEQMKVARRKVGAVGGLGGGGGNSPLSI